MLLRQPPRPSQSPPLASEHHCQSCCQHQRSRGCFLRSTCQLRALYLHWHRPTSENAQQMPRSAPAVRPQKTLLPTLRQLLLPIRLLLLLLLLLLLIMMQLRKMLVLQKMLMLMLIVSPPSAARQAQRKLAESEAPRGMLNEFAKRGPKRQSQRVTWTLRSWTPRARPVEARGVAGASNATIPLDAPQPACLTPRLRPCCFLERCEQPQR